MWTLKTSVAGAAGMMLVGAMLVIPGVAAQVSGRAAAWGANCDGQLGNNSISSSTVPVDTSGLLAGKTLTAISGGDYHSCASAEGRAYCWGDNVYGQLGKTTTNTGTVKGHLEGRG